MAAANEELEAKEYEAAAGGGAVKVKVTGKMELVSVEIQPEVVDPDDVEMLGDLLMAAANEALRTAAKEKEEKMEALSGGLNIPGMF
jgi:DNA-binding YbaB/EbfC family protein